MTNAATQDLVVGTAGHIDHGKTSLVAALTGVDTDRLPAEKQRGITIDLGFAALEVEPYRFALVDVPGHERFVRNMLAGATGLDLALLVVAADDSVMPQTREHFEILELLGLGGGVIALTKADLVSNEWLALVADEVRELVRGSFLESAPIVPTSAASGQGIGELKAALGRAARAMTRRPDPGAFRMAIDRAFTIAGHGTVVTGSVASGRIAVGDELEWWPEGRLVRVRGLHRHDRPEATVGRGARAAINLAGVRHEEVRRGQELATPGYLAATRRLSVEIRVLPEAPRPIRHKRRYRLHIGTSEVVASLSLLSDTELPAGSRDLAQWNLSQPIVTVAGEPFIAREESPARTVGGGRVLEPHPERIRRRDTAGRARVAALANGDGDERLVAAATALGLETRTSLALSRLANVPVAEIPARVANLVDTGRLQVVPIGPRSQAHVSVEFLNGLEKRALRIIGQLHAARARSSALPLGDVLAALSGIGPEAVVGFVLDRLTQARRLFRTGRSVALPEHAPKLSQAERRLKDAIAEALQRGGAVPPDQAQLEALDPTRATVVPDLLALLFDEGSAVEIARGLWLDTEVESTFRRRVTERLSLPDAPGLTMAEMRDVLGTTRKFAVPYGEYLDRLGVTRREGDLRYLRDEERPAKEPSR